MSTPLAQILVNACDPDDSKRVPAEKMLKEFEATNFPSYLQGLCEQMQNSKIPVNPRIQAGVQLKNTLVSRSEQKNLQLEKRWLMLQPQVRSQIKMRMLHSLNLPEQQLRNIAAQVVAKVAKIEIPRDQWSGLIPQLVHVIAEEKTTDQLKEACFTTLGYVCEECPKKLQNHSNMILNAIASGMAVKQSNSRIKLEATKALANSLPMVKKNFSHEKERHLIMSMIFNAAKSKDSNVRYASIQCLSEVARTYYKHLDSYMSGCYKLTSEAIQNEHDEIKKQAIEFWSSICEQEIDIQEEIEEKSSSTPRKMYGFMKKAASQLIPNLLKCLTQQSEDPEDDEWNVAQAAACCMELIAQDIGDDILDHVMPFIIKNMRNENWRLREAAVISFACVLAGPAKVKMRGLVKDAFPHILKHMKDNVPQVKDSAAWCVGKICEEIPEIITKDILRVLMQTLLHGLNEHPKIAVHVCWAIHNLAEEVKVVGNTSALSPYFQDTVAALLKTAFRNDADNNLQHDAFEAFNIMVYTAAPDSFPMIKQLIPEMMNRLKMTLERFQRGSLSLSDSTRLSNMQAQLCAGLNYAYGKLGKHAQDVLKFIPPLMNMLIAILNLPGSEAHEEALICVSTVARCTHEEFSIFMKGFGPQLMKFLKETSSSKVCSLATGVVGDIARALELKIAPYCDAIVTQLMTNAQNHGLDQNVKPRILNSLGDIALAIGGKFEKYLPYVMNLLKDASTVEFKDDRDDYATVEYLNVLRESILEAYVSVLQGLHDDNKDHLFFPYMDNLVYLLHKIAEDSDVDAIVVKASCSVIGDIARMLGAKHEKVRSFLLSNAKFKKIIDSGMTSGDSRKQAEYATRELQALN